MAQNYTQDQVKDILDRLSDPFDPALVRWRVVSKSKDGKKGQVMPYVDMRAYSGRLNEVLGPSGWTFDLNTTTTPGLTRMKRDKIVQSGKVTVVASLKIDGIGAHTSAGEMWADDDNAITRAEAQAKKRAASLFGMGEYFYRMPELGPKLWVPIDEYGAPKSVPVLPSWALPKSMRNAGASKQPTSNNNSSSSSATKPVGGAQQPTATNITDNSSSRSASFLAVVNERSRKLGDALTRDVLMKCKERIPTLPDNVNPEEYALEKLNNALTLLSGVITKAGDLSTGDLDKLMASHGVTRLDQLPSYGRLYELAEHLGVVPKRERSAAA